MKQWMAQVLDFFDWWFEEIQSLVLRNKSPSRSSAPDWTVHLAEDGIRIHKTDGAEFQSPPLDLRASARDISEKFEPRLGKLRSCDVRLSNSICLKRQLASYRLPRRQARAMATLDLVATTPIDTSQARLLFTDSSGMDCAYHVVKKKTLASLVEALNASGISIRFIRIGDRDSAVPLDRLSKFAITRPSARERLFRRIVLTMACFTAVAALVTYGHLEWRYWRAASELDEKITSVEIEAKAARTMLRQQQIQLEQIEKIRKEKSNATSVVRLLAEVTHLLPDSAWVTDFSARNNTLTISGYATSASELIGPLEASPLLASPEFSAPVTKIPGQAGERFTISAKTGEI